MPHPQPGSGSGYAATPNRPWSKRAPNRTWDYLIVGSGVGGMTAAGFLAKMGKRVLVLEQHSTPGGFTHTFSRHGYRWDVGLHSVGEMSEGSMPGRVMRILTGDRVGWSSVGPIYDELSFPEGFHIGFPDNVAAFQDVLGEAFPSQRRVVADYLKLMHEASQSMRGLFLARTAPPFLNRPLDWLATRKARAFVQRTTKDVLDSIGADRRLSAVLTGQWGYYGAKPSRSSFASHSMVARHFSSGGHYPIGGSREIAMALLQAVADCGGWTRVGADVEQIVIEKGRAVGVRLRDGEVIRAKRIISAVGITATVQRLLPEAHRRSKWGQQVGALKATPAHFALYLGFKGDIREAGASSTNQWFYNTWDLDIDGWNVHPDRELGVPPWIFCSFPSLKDPQHDPGPEQRHVGEVIALTPWEGFQQWAETHWNDRGAPYDEFKLRVQEHLLEHFLQKMPELRPLIDYVELSTPLSTDEFCRPVRGAMYGIEPTPERLGNSWLRPRSPIPGLFFTGNEITSCGVVGAMMSGTLTVLSAEPRRGIPYVLPILEG